MRLSLFALVFLASAVPASAQPVAPGTRVEGVAAVIGDQVVLYSEVDALVENARTQQPGVQLPPDAWSRALDQLVDRRVIIDNARRDTTLQITDAQVDEEVNKNVQQFVAQLGSEAAVEAAFGRPMSQIRDSFREEIRDDLLLQQYRGRRLQGVAVTPGEVRTWFDAIPAGERPQIPEIVRVAHVVRKPAPAEAARAQARAFAEALRDSVVAGQATLGDLANRHSTDPGNTNRDGTKNGGAYPSFALRDLDPTFAAAASALAPGGLSQAFETGFGFHVLRLDTRTGDRIGFSHILVPITTNLDEARTMLGVLRDSVVTGRVPFEAIARRHSEDPFSASRGGFVSDPQTGERDLRLDALGAAWKATVDSMAVGDISEIAPVTLLDAQQTNVLHFVLLQKRAPAHTLSLADDYSLLADYTLRTRRQDVLREWVDGLRRSTYVDVRAPQYTAASPTAALVGGSR